MAADKEEEADGPFYIRGRAEIFSAEQMIESHGRNSLVE